jgi:hypothetical protein
MLPTWRFALLQRLIKACKPTISADYISATLGFTNIEDGIEFLRKAGAVLIPKSPEGDDGNFGDGLSGSQGLSSSGLDVDVKASATTLDPTLGEADQALLL